MTGQEDDINLGKSVLEDNNTERKSWTSSAQTCSRSLIVSLLQIFVILLFSCSHFWRVLPSKICDESTVWLEVLCSAAGYKLLSPRPKKANFYNKSCLNTSHRSTQAGKYQLINNLLKMKTAQPKPDKTYFLSTLRSHFAMLSKKKSENLHSAQGVKFDF